MDQQLGFFLMQFVLWLFFLLLSLVSLVVAPRHLCTIWFKISLPYSTIILCPSLLISSIGRSDDCVTFRISFLITVSEDCGSLWVIWSSPSSFRYFSFICLEWLWPAPSSALIFHIPVLFSGIKYSPHLPDVHSLNACAIVNAPHLAFFFLFPNTFCTFHKMSWLYQFSCWVPHLLRLLGSASPHLPHFLLFLFFHDFS